MLSYINNYFLNLPEPAAGCLQAMRQYILNSDPAITETWKYAMPVYCYNGKMCCYIRVDKKSGLPYMGVVEGVAIHNPLLVKGDRARMKVLMLDPNNDLPLDIINDIMAQIVRYYKAKKA